MIDGALGPGTTAGLGSLLASPTSAGGLGRPDLLPDLLAPITSLQSYNFGLPVVYLQGFGDPTTDINYTQLGAFVQDEVRLGSRATLSLALRYDTDWRDPSVNVASASAPFVLERSVITDRNNFAPRLGAAYALGADHETVLRGGWGLFYQNALQVSGFTSRVLSGQISQVFLPLTGIPGVNGTSADVWQRYVRDGHVDQDTLTSLGISPGTTPAVLLVGRDGTPNPVSAQASAGVEHAFAADWAMAAEYSYNRGRHILRSRDVNVRSVGPNTFALPGLDPRFLQLGVLEGTGRSEYHGLSLSLRRRYADRWGMSASYTFGHAMDDVTDFTVETQPDDQTNLGAEWGPSSFDQRHRFVASAVWQSPVGDAVPVWLADWSLAPIVTYASGRPFTALTGFDANGDSHADTDRARLQSGAASRPQQRDRTGLFQRGFSAGAIDRVDPSNAGRADARGVQPVQPCQLLRREPRVRQLRWYRTGRFGGASSSRRRCREASRRRSPRGSCSWVRGSDSEQSSVFGFGLQSWLGRVKEVGERSQRRS